MIKVEIIDKKIKNTKILKHLAQGRLTFDLAQTLACPDGTHSPDCRRSVYRSRRLGRAPDLARTPPTSPRQTTIRRSASSGSRP